MQNQKLQGFYCFYCILFYCIVGCVVTEVHGVKPKYRTCSYINISLTTATAYTSGSLIIDNNSYFSLD